MFWNVGRLVILFILPIISFEDRCNYAPTSSSTAEKNKHSCSKKNLTGYLVRSESKITFLIKQYFPSGLSAWSDFYFSKWSLTIAMPEWKPIVSLFHMCIFILGIYIQLINQNSWLNIFQSCLVIQLLHLLIYIWTLLLSVSLTHEQKIIGTFPPPSEPSFMKTEF